MSRRVRASLGIGAAVVAAWALARARGGLELPLFALRAYLVASPLMTALWATARRGARGAAAFAGVSTFGLGLVATALALLPDAERDRFCRGPGVFCEDFSAGLLVLVTPVVTALAAVTAGLSVSLRADAREHAPPFDTPPIGGESSSRDT